MLQKRVWTVLHRFPFQNGAENSLGFCSEDKTRIVSHFQTARRKQILSLQIEFLFILSRPVRSTI